MGKAMIIHEFLNYLDRKYLAPLLPPTSRQIGTGSKGEAQASVLKLPHFQINTFSNLSAVALAKVDQINLL
jgi:hypothetical protein